MGRVGQPKDCGDQASWITGAIVPVDGGKDLLTNQNW